MPEELQMDHNGWIQALILRKQRARTLLKRNLALEFDLNRIVTVGMDGIRELTPPKVRSLQ